MLQAPAPVQVRTAARPGVLMLAHLLAARRDSFDGTLVLCFLAAILVVGLLAWYFSKEERLKRRLKATRVRLIADLHPGEPARVIGTARLQGAALTAPVSGRTCVYYSAEVRAKRGKHWRTIIREARGLPFLVDDGSGLALVDPQRAEVVLDRDANTRSGTFDDPDAAQQRLLARHGESGQGLLFNRSLRYHEAVIEVGERVAVLGAPRHEPDRSAGAPVVLSGSLEGRLVICDAPATTRG